MGVFELGGQLYEGLGLPESVLKLTQTHDEVVDCCLVVQVLLGGVCVD